MAFTDPCEIIRDDDDDSESGSTPPPSTVVQEDGVSEDPIFPWTNQEVTTIEAGETYLKKISIIDSSNFYASPEYPDSALGIRTPGELQVPILGYTSDRQETEQYEEAQNLIKRENRIRNLESTPLDIPIRDNFRHMLSCVWTRKSNTIGLKTSPMKRTVYTTTRHWANRVGPNGEAIGEGFEDTHIYDYSRSSYEVFGETRNRTNRTPFILYVWNELGVLPNAGAIMSPYNTHLGLRFDLKIMAEKMENSNYTRNDFWNKDSVLETINIEGDSHRVVKQRHANEILDLWVLGITSARDQNKNKVNPGEEFLIKYNSDAIDQLPPGADSKIYFEDYTFQAPASVDIDQANPRNTASRYRDLVDGDLPQLSDIVTIRSFASASDFLYREDRSNLEAQVRLGNLEIADLPNQPFNMSIGRKVNFYAFAQAQHLAEQSGQDPEPIAIDTTAQIYPSNAARRMNNFSQDILNPKYEEISKHHVRIWFDTPHTSEIAEILKYGGLDHMALEIFHNSQNTNETFTQFIDGIFTGDRSSSFVDSFDRAARVNAAADRIENLTTPKKVKDFFYLLESQQDFYGNDQYMQQSNLLYPFGHPASESPLAEDFSTRLDLARRRLFQYLSNKRRKYNDILQGNYCHSEVIAYKIVKSDSKNPDEELQTFYIFNNQDRSGPNRMMNEISFVDTQVLPGNSYQYSIFTINAVVGMEYSYNEEGTGKIEEGGRGAGSYLKLDPVYEASGMVYPSNPVMGANQEQPLTHPTILERSPYYRINVHITNHLSLIEAPFYKKTVSVDDSPPSTPEIVFLPEVGVGDKFTLLFRPQIGSEHYHKPIAILPTDFPIIEKMVSESMYREQGNPEKIRYQSAAAPLVYELIMLDTMPTRYSDFSEGRVFKTDFSTPLLNFKVDINKSYYIIARSHDRTGISNPTEVLKIRMESHEDGINPILEPFEMKTEFAMSEISFQNVISIQPSKKQRIIDFGSESESLGDSFYQSAPSLDSISLSKLGQDEEKIWGKKYKFRLKSKSTGKSIDINVSFAEEKKEVANEQYSSQEFLEASRPMGTSVSYRDVSTDQQFRYTSTASDYAELEPDFRDANVEEQNVDDPEAIEPEGFNEVGEEETLDELFEDFEQPSPSMDDVSPDGFTEPALTPGQVEYDIQIDVAGGAPGPVHDPFVGPPDGPGGIGAYNPVGGVSNPVTTGGIDPFNSAASAPGIGALGAPANASSGTPSVVGAKGVVTGMDEADRNSAKKLHSSDSNTSSAVKLGSSPAASVQAGTSPRARGAVQVQMPDNATGADGMPRSTTGGFPGVSPGVPRY
jgi:hypothetical protein